MTMIRRTAFRKFLPEYFLGYCLFFFEGFEKDVKDKSPEELEKMHEESIAAAQKMLNLLGEKISSRKLVLGVAHALAGNQEEASKILDEGIALSEKIYVAPFFIALIYALLNERDKAFEWLQKAYEERDHWLCHAKASPQFDNLRPDPRFKELLKKMGLE